VSAFGLHTGLRPGFAVLRGWLAGPPGLRLRELLLAAGLSSARSSWPYWTCG